MIQGKWAEVWTKLSKISVNDTNKMPLNDTFAFFNSDWKRLELANTIFSEMYKSLQEVLQAMLQLANTSMQKS